MSVPLQRQKGQGEGKGENFDSKGSNGLVVQFG